MMKPGDWNYKIKEVLNYNLFNKPQIVYEYVDKIMAVLGSEYGPVSSIVPKCDYSHLDRTITMITVSSWNGHVALSIISALYKLCCAYKTAIDQNIMDMCGKNYVTVFDYIMETHDMDSLGSLIHISIIPCGEDKSQITIRLY